MRHSLLAGLLLCFAAQAAEVPQDLIKGPGPGPDSGPVPRESAEVKARSAIAGQTSDLLNARDYPGLEKLHRKLDNDKLRTPSGVWQLAVFYATLRDYPRRTRDLAYWKQEDAQAAQWAAQFPRSDVAAAFQIYLKQNRALSFRGNGNYADIRKEDIAPMQQAVKEALALFDARGRIPMSRRDAIDGGWHRARLDILPYSELFHSHFGYAVESAVKAAPDYHEVYFGAAYYSLPKWGGAPDAVERMARLASTGKGADRDAMYARVYWYLNQTEYHGRIFDDSMVDWDDMKTSFDALVRAYPDPYNLNAYAYFACKVGDYDAMSALLKRIGDDVVPGVWVVDGQSRSQSQYQRCADNIGADTRNFAADLAARNKRLQGEQYNRLIGYAIVQRERFRNEESLRALQSAAVIGQKLWNRPGMRVYFHKARALDNLARFDEEIEALREGLLSQPGYPSAIFQMGIAYEGLKRKEEARAQFALAAQRTREELAKPGVERTADVQKELERMRPKLVEYDIDTRDL
jgi:tetratricopeptide (TPR) repeat protein